MLYASAAIMPSCGCMLGGCLCPPVRLPVTFTYNFGCKWCVFECVNSSSKRINISSNYSHYPTRNVLATLRRVSLNEGVVGLWEICDFRPIYGNDTRDSMLSVERCHFQWPSTTPVPWPRFQEPANWRWMSQKRYKTHMLRKGFLHVVYGVISLNDLEWPWVT